MTDPLGEVGVVIVTFNSAEHVGGALGMLPVEKLAGTVVVDNASTDETVDVVRKLDLRNTTVVTAGRNGGFGAGCNEGAQRLPQARAILFLNPDAIIDEGSLRLLVRRLSESNRCAIVAPALWRDGERLRSAGSRVTVWSALVHVMPRRIARLVVDRGYWSEPLRSGPVGFVEGACMLADAEAFRAVGGFDEDFFLFFEEHDLARRLETIGRCVELCAEATAQHAVGRSRVALPHQGEAALVESTVRYLKRWEGTLPTSFYVAVASISWGLRELLGAVDRGTTTRWKRAMATGWKRPARPRSGQ